MIDALFGKIRDNDIELNVLMDSAGIHLEKSLSETAILRLGGRTGW